VWWKKGLPVAGIPVTICFLIIGAISRLQIPAWKRTSLIQHSTWFALIDQEKQDKVEFKIEGTHAPARIHRP